MYFWMKFCLSLKCSFPILAQGTRQTAVRWSRLDRVQVWIEQLSGSFWPESWNVCLEAQTWCLWCPSGSRGLDMAVKLVPFHWYELSGWWLFPWTTLFHCKDLISFLWLCLSAFPHGNLPSSSCFSFSLLCKKVIICSPLCSVWWGFARGLASHLGCGDWLRQPWGTVEGQP